MENIWRVNCIRMRGKVSWYIYRLKDPTKLDVMRNRDILPGIRFKEKSVAENSAKEMNKNDHS